MLSILELKEKIKKRKKKAEGLVCSLNVERSPMILSERTVSLGKDFLDNFSGFPKGLFQPGFILYPSQGQYSTFSWKVFFFFPFYHFLFFFFPFLIPACVSAFSIWRSFAIIIAILLIFPYSHLPNVVICSTAGLTPRSPVLFLIPFSFLPDLVLNSPLLTCSVETQLFSPILSQGVINEFWLKYS